MATLPYFREPSSYANQFSEAADKKYREFTPEGVLNALATTAKNVPC